MKVKQVTALLRLFEETQALSRRLRAVSGDPRSEEALSAGRRGILQSLNSTGAQTVPQLARARAVSRQHIQLLVNALLADGLAATAPNPAHKASPLIDLTGRGKRQLRAVQIREKKLLAHFHLGLPAKEIDSASATLRAVSRAMKGGAQERV